MMLSNKTHPYLERKRILSTGTKEDKRKQCLVVPIRDIDETLQNVQFIYADGTKRFFKGARKQGFFHIIGLLDAVEKAYVVEGFATGMSIYMATNKPVIVAFDSGNISYVVGAVKGKYPSLMLTIAGDNDCWGAINLGKAKAEQAAARHNCNFILPEFFDLQEGEQPSDWNDLHIRSGLCEVRRQLEGVRYD